MFAKDLTGCLIHCCVEGGDHWICVCIFVAHDGERCKPPAYHSLEAFQHVRIFQLFEVKLESCVFWLADFFQAKLEGHHQQVVITSNVCSWKTSCSGNIHSWPTVLPHKNVINLVVVLSIWAMPCPSSGCFVMTKCVRQHKVVKGGKLQKSESSLICSSLQKGPQMPCQFPPASLPTFAFQSPCTTRMSFFGVWSMTFCSWS